ncbi:MAG: DNA cytosine methyltransferase [Jatrophihabitantaceae bacterium]
MRSVELFAGAGGLALGVQLAGFESARVVEWDRWACDTMRENKAKGYPLVGDWNIAESDVRALDWTQITEPIDLVAGGPPCQPFSMGGKARAANDSRDMFPAATEVIRTLRPKAFILENVRGLTREKFANYFNFIQLRLSMPEIVARDGETWLDHFQRLQSEHTSTGDSGLTYRVLPTLVNAADYGVPQQRWRVFLVGFRSDVDAEWAFPEPTHSRDALLHAKASGSYWERHKIARSKRPASEPIPTGLFDDDLKPWRTVRDALVGLPTPTVRGSTMFLNHVLQEGARSYTGHTGSPLDDPSKALKAGDHGVPGGENMLRDLDGNVRYFTVRESARLQTFPDRYELHGSWTEAMRQLGNAVPVLLGQKVAGSVSEHLASAELKAVLATRVERRKMA